MKIDGTPEVETGAQVNQQQGGAGVNMDPVAPADVEGEQGPGAVVNENQVASVDVQEPVSGAGVCEGIRRSLAECESKFPQLWASSPVWKAMFYEDEKLLQRTIEEGADVNAYPTPEQLLTVNWLTIWEPRGCRPIVYAMYRAWTPAVQMLIDAGADVKSESIPGIPLLVFAIYCGYWDLVPRLLAVGADVNRADGARVSPLQMACVAAPGKRVALTLLEAGADVNDSNCQGYTVLYYAIQAVARALSREQNEEAELKMELLTHLLSAGADVNFSVPNGPTPLQEALVHRVPISRIMPFGPDVTFVRCLEDNLHVTCTAMETDQVQNLAVLLQHGAELCRCSWFVPSDLVDLPVGHERRLKFDLLRAAGGKVKNARVRKMARPVSLQRLCRKNIRRHLMEISRVNLFARVPLLDITHIAKEYLLFNFDVESLANSGVAPKKPESNFVAHDLPPCPWIFPMMPL